MDTTFRRLNEDWNAEPNAPDPSIRVSGTDVALTFLANPFEFPRFAEGQLLRLRFTSARKYRLGPTNDHGWYLGQCRFSGVAPRWGEFYEVSGDLRLDGSPTDWLTVATEPSPGRHFLFYLRDGTFECEADDWTLEE